MSVDVTLGPHRRLQRIARIPVVPGSDAVTVVPRSITVEALVPITYDKGLTPAQFVATVSAPDIGDAQTAVKVKPEVRLKEPADPAIIIKGIFPPEVEVQKK